MRRREIILEHTSTVVATALEAKRARAVATIDLVNCMLEILSV